MTRPLVKLDDKSPNHSRAQLKGEHSAHVNLFQLIQQHNENRPADQQRRLRAVRPVEGGMIEMDGRQFVDFASNDYLGLAGHQKLAERSRLWAEKFGSGARASRLVSGNFECLEQLEEKLANLKHRPTSLIFGSGFQANSSVLAALLGTSSEPVQVFSDRLCHASFHFGLAAASVRQRRFRHNDLAHLRSLLEKHARSGEPSLIATESVFSMDGDQLDVAAIRNLAREFDALLYVDEAHAAGVFGEHGMGLMDGVSASENEVTIGTFGKALGSYGASVCCTETIRDYLINRCSGLIYSTALPPSILGAIDAALDLVPNMDDERTHVLNLAHRLRDRLHDAGLNTLNSTTQIIPVVLGNNETTIAIANELAEHGFLVGAIRPPTVPPDSARLRVSLSAAHNEQQVDQFADALVNSYHKRFAGSIGSVGANE